MMNRPSFQQAWQRFNEINLDIVEVGKKIGGNVGVNIELGINDPLQGFTNACAIRMSYTLNYSGFKVERGSWKTVSGKDKNWYIYRVRDVINFLSYKFSKPDRTIKNNRGILVFTVPGWNDASGHATLWNGTICSDHCYFPKASEASIWLLK
ncbi:MAG: type VI secretion system amidase effector protein Tae4 [Serratia proteamaculans]